MLTLPNSKAHTHTHTHKDMCTATHSKQSVTMHESVHPQPNLTWVNACTLTLTHTHTQL